MCRNNHQNKCILELNFRMSCWSFISKQKSINWLHFRTITGYSDKIGPSCKFVPQWVPCWVSPSQTKISCETRRQPLYLKWKKCWHNCNSTADTVPWVWHVRSYLATKHVIEAFACHTFSIGPIYSAVQVKSKSFTDKCKAILSRVGKKIFQHAAQWYSAATILLPVITDLQHRGDA